MKSPGGNWDGITEVYVCKTVMRILFFLFEIVKREENWIGDFFMRYSMHAFISLCVMKSLMRRARVKAFHKRVVHKNVNM